MGRRAHQFPIEVVMRAAAAQIDEPGLRRERDFLDERRDYVLTETFG
jgi:hypothetical protein